MVIHFSGYELDLSIAELTKDGLPVRIQPQPLKVLCLLASRPGQVVSREELRDEIWQSQTFVDFEQGLNTCVRQIRAALNDNPDAPRFVETVPRRGYRFIGTISENGGTASPAVVSPTPDLAPASSHWKLWSVLAVLTVVVAASLYAGMYYWRAANTAKPGRVTLAVLPFEDLSPGARDLSFSDGLTEEMITQIGELEPTDLGVIARTSTVQYRGTSKSVEQIAAELGVGYVLEGSVRREDNRVRIVAKLIQADDQTPLWANTFESDGKNLLALQNQVALRVARTLALKLLPSGRDVFARISTTVPDAYDDYLRARQLSRKGDAQSLLESIPYYEAAIRHDPNYAIAYAALAETYLTLSDRRTIPPQRAFPRAKQAIQEVLELDPSFTEGYAVLAATRAFYDWDWKAAEPDFLHAMERKTTSSSAHLLYARYLRALGRMDEALAQIQAAQKLEPDSPMVTLNLAAFYYYARNPDRAIEIAQQLVTADPKAAAGRLLQGMSYEQKGDLKQALTLLQEAVSLSDNNSMYLGALGHAYGVAGMKPEAQKVLTQLSSTAPLDYVSQYDVALVQSALGDSDAALKSLQRACDEKALSLRYVNIDPRFDSLRKDARFQAVVKRVGLNQ